MNGLRSLGLLQTIRKMRNEKKFGVGKKREETDMGEHG